MAQRQLLPKIKINLNDKEYYNDTKVKNKYASKSSRSASR